MHKKSIKTRKQNFVFDKGSANPRVQPAKTNLFNEVLLTT